jgi:hypothetical protein
MHDIFITGTFRDEWSRRYNERLERALCLRGFSCYLPQRDSEQEGKPERTFAQDLVGVQGARVLLAVGARAQTANWGFEIGYAYRCATPVIIISTTDRAVELLPAHAALRIIVPADIDDIESYADDLAATLRSLIASRG